MLYYLVNILFKTDSGVHSYAEVIYHKSKKDLDTITNKLLNQFVKEVGYNSWDVKHKYITVNEFRMHKVKEY